LAEEIDSPLKAALSAALATVTAAASVKEVRYVALGTTLQPSTKMEPVSSTASPTNTETVTAVTAAVYATAEVHEMMLDVLPERPVMVAEQSPAPLPVPARVRLASSAVPPLT
jgi:hypothetical protein